MRAGTAGLVAATFGVVAFCVAIECGLSVPFVAAGDAASDVDALIAKLVGGDAKAGDALVAMGAAAVPRLAAAATSPPVPTRIVALDTLGRIAADHDEAVAPLTSSLADLDVGVRVAAARGLCAAGPRAKPAAAALDKAMHDESPRVRVEAAAALYRGGATSTSLFALSAGTKEKDVATRVAAVDAIVRARVPAASAAPILLDALKDADLFVRISAIHALAALGAKDDAVAVGIARCTLSFDETERADATAALRKITDVAAFELLHVGGALRGDRLRRLKAKYLGSSPQVDQAVVAALDWLARHQSPDGSWSCDKFDALCKLNKCDGTGFAEFTPGVTALALLAFLGAGETHTYGAHKDVVARGLAYVRAIQGADGRVGVGSARLKVDHWTSYGMDMFGGYSSSGKSEPVDGTMYDHAVATVALCEAFMLSGDAETGDAARRAVAFVLKTRNPEAAWHDAFPPDGRNDTSITGWTCWALATARAAGIDVDKSAFDDSAAWVTKKTEPEFGRTGYQQIGGPPARLAGAEAFPADKSESLTAIGVMIRLFAGHKPKDDEFIAKGASLVAKKFPHWNVDAGCIDFYYWFWGSTTMRQIGGEPCKKWSDGMKTALVGAQRGDKDGCARGSWDPVDAWSPVGGRVYSTAMCCMTLESYWRMDSLLDAK